MFSCSHGGRLCTCGHIKAEHYQNASPGRLKECCGTGDDAWSCKCKAFVDRSPETAPKEEVIPPDQNKRGIAAKRIWV